MIKPNDHLSESDILIAVSQNGIHSPWEDHLSECATCQSALERSAAEQLHWKAVREILTTGEIEFDFGSLTRSHLEQVKRESTSKEERSLVSQLLEPPTHPEMLGRVGRYEVERLLGTGGMGVVFKAYDTELHRAVAIKFLAPHLIHSGAARKRFAREARAAAAIVNDHVVPIHNVETEAEHPYIVMQYIGGDSLQERIDREGPLEVSEILRIGMQIATGLAAAHAQGLTHRDIKPSNIMLDENVSRALLTDFGLARTNDDARLTHSGVHLGTPNFMSPEQIRNEAIDQRSDLFSFGCVLYTLCTGRPPFRAEQAFAVMRRITDEAPRPIRETNPDIPEWLERIVLRLMSKQVEDRYQSAYEVAELLKECLAHATAPSDHPLPVSLMASSAIGRGGNRYLGWLIAMGSFGVLFAGVLVILESSKGTITIQSDTDDVPIRVTKSGQFVERFTVSQDGKSIRVAAGEYTIELENQDAGLEIKGDQVLVKRGESSIVTIELAQKNDQIPTDRSVSELAAKGTPSNLLRSLRVIENGTVVEGNGVVKQIADKILNSTAHELGNPRLWDEVILTLHLTRSQELMGQTHSSNKYESTHGVKSVEIFIQGTHQQIIDNQLPDQIRQAGIWAMIPAAPRWIGVGYGKLDMLPSERMKLTEQLLQSREHTLEAIMDSTYLQGNARPVGSFQDSSDAAALILFEYLKQERGLQAILDFGRAIQTKQELNAAINQNLHYGSRDRLIETLGTWLNDIRETNEAKVSALSGSTISNADIKNLPVSFPTEIQGNWIVQVASRGSFKVPSYIKQHVEIDSQYITLRTNNSSQRYRVTSCAPLQADLFTVDLTALAPDGSGTKTFQCLMQVWDNRLWLVRPQDPSKASPHRYALEARPHRYASDINESVSELVLSMNRSSGGTSTKDAPPEVTTDPSLVGSNSDDPTSPLPRNLEAGSAGVVLPKSIIGQWVIENATSRSTPIPAYAGQQVWIAADSITIARDGTPSRYQVTHWKPLPGNVFEVDLTKNLPNSTETTMFQCLMSVDGQKIRLCRPQRPGRSRPSQQELEGKSDPSLYRGETVFELRVGVVGRLSQETINDDANVTSVTVPTTTPRFGRLWHQPALAGLRLQCPAVESEGRVYVGYTDRILGLDLHDGSVKWEQQVPNGIAGGMIIQDGWLVVGDRAKNVHCFSTRDSSKRWQVELESNLAVQPTIKKAFRSDDYTVILPTEHGPIQCLSLATGESVYRFNQSRRATGPVMGVRGMGLVVACGNNNLLHRFICREGTEQPTSIPTENVVSHQPAVHEEFVHVRTSDGGIAKYDMICESFEWSFSPKQQQKPTTSPAIIVGDAFGRFPHDGIVVFTVGDSIYGVDWRYGTSVWERSLEANLSDPIIANERVWVCTKLGHLCALDPKTGATLWNSQASEKPESISSPPVVIKNPQLRGTRIVVVTDSGSITCFEDADKGAISENDQSR